MKLYENLNVALREREMQTMRLKLESLKQKIEERLEFQASVEAMKADLKASELQDLRIRLQELIEEGKRMKLEAKKQQKKQIRRPTPPKRNGVSKNTVDSAPKANGVELKKNVAPGIIKKEPKKKNGVEVKSTIRLGPFTPRD